MNEVKITHNTPSGEPYNGPQPTVTSHPIDMEELRCGCEQDWANDPNIRDTFASADEYFHFVKAGVEKRSATID